MYEWYVVVLFVTLYLFHVLAFTLLDISCFLKSIFTVKIITTNKNKLKKFLLSLYLCFSSFKWFWQEIFALVCLTSSVITLQKQKSHPFVVKFAIDQDIDFYDKMNPSPLDIFSTTMYARLSLRIGVPFVCQVESENNRDRGVLNVYTHKCYAEKISCSCLQRWWN